MTSYFGKARLLTVFFFVFLPLGMSDAGAIDPVMQRIEAEFKTYADPYAPSYQQRIAKSKLARALDLIREQYFEPVGDGTLLTALDKGTYREKAKLGSTNPIKLAQGVVKALADGLDPYTSYLPPDVYKEMSEGKAKKVIGVGMTVTMKEGILLVISPIEDTPAFKAGLKARDVITHVDGEAIKDMTLEQAVNKIRGEEGSTVKLTIQRADTTPFDVSIVRKPFQVPVVRSRHLEGGIGYLRLTSFTRTAAERISEEFDKLNGEEEGGLKGVILDVRGNPGGLLTQALEVSDLFLNEGTIISIRGRTDQSRQTFKAEDGDITEGLPMILLINKGSASASEIVAGALGQNHRARLIGSLTFGKGVMQTVYPLMGDDGIKVTTAKLLIPDGTAYDGKGIAPDITVEDGENYDDDPVLDRAVAILNGKEPPAAPVPMAAE